MQTKLNSFDPYLTYTSGERHFLQSNGTPTFSGWSSVSHPILMNDDALDLWRLGKRAFDSLNGIEKIKNKEEFKFIHQKYRELLCQLRKTFTERTKNHPNSIIFRSLDGDKVTPDFEEASDSAIVDLAWQAARSQSEDCQIFGEMFIFVCFEEIENSIIGMCLDGNYAVSGALSAAEAFSNFQAIDSGNEYLQKIRSEFASRAAVERHKRDPKQKAKKFIKDCWCEWQEKPERYSKQTDFVIDVLNKIDTNEKGDAIVSFDTVLKKWIPEWTKERK